MEVFIINPIYTEDELAVKCEQWQKTLRLQDWIVNVRIERERDMTLKENCGEVEASLPKRMATIRLLDPVDYPPNLAEAQDMELTLVHELLHLHLFPFTKNLGELEQTFEEQAIEAISRALVSLARKEI